MPILHNESDIISDKLYRSIVYSVGRALGYELYSWEVNVNDDERMMTVRLDSNIKKYAIIDYGVCWETVCRESYFDKVYDYFFKQWEPNPFVDMEFDEDAFEINMFFDTDEVINVLEKEIEDWKDNQLIQFYNKTPYRLIYNSDDSKFEGYNRVKLK
jgi:hypothetical protein